MPPLFSWASLVASLVTALPCTFGRPLLRNKNPLNFLPATHNFSWAEEAQKQYQISNPLDSLTDPPLDADSAGYSLHLLQIKRIHCLIRAWDLTLLGAVKIQIKVLRIIPFSLLLLFLTLTGEVSALVDNSLHSSCPDHKVWLLTLGQLWEIIKCFFFQCTVVHECTTHYTLTLLGYNMF